MLGVLSRRWRQVALGFLVLLSVASVPAAADPPQITDAANDAYRYPDTPLGQPEPKPPMEPLSNDAADVVTVGFAAAPPLNPTHQHAYTVSVSITGQPHSSFNYIVGALFGEDCFLIHFLTPGQTRKAMAYCGFGEDFRQVGTITGSVVAVKDNTVTATFGFRKFALPQSLKTEPEIGPLWIQTCPVTGSSWACNDNDLDWAFSENTFRLF